MEDRFSVSVNGRDVASFRINITSPDAKHRIAFEIRKAGNYAIRHNLPDATIALWENSTCGCAYRPAKAVTVQASDVVYFTLPNNTVEPNFPSLPDTCPTCGKES